MPIYSALPEDDLLDRLLDRLAHRIALQLKHELTPAEPASPKRAFRTREVGELLSVSARTVEDLIRRGEMESIKVGNIRLVASSAIDRFLERAAVETIAARGDKRGDS